ncbi:MAG TPA: methylmalonyl-CoA epimerase, partial [Paracoccaceae bacterium]|nr:methylmalonyl-CoA epimerase [Paracoccaceae bacterium]
RVSPAQDEPDHGVTVVFVELPNTKIELLHPLGENSPIAGFLAKNPSGGIHHVCYEVADIRAARDQLRARGARVLGDGEPKIGAHGKPVLFLHPKDFNGTLVELEEA